MAFIHGKNPDPNFSKKQIRFCNTDVDIRRWVGKVSIWGEDAEEEEDEDQDGKAKKHLNKKEELMIYKLIVIRIQPEIIKIVAALAILP